VFGSIARGDDRDVRGPAESALPVAIGQDGPKRAARRIVLFAEEPAKQGLDPQQR
jgi:hypothetical protein